MERCYSPGMPWGPLTHVAGMQENSSDLTNATDTHSNVGICCTRGLSSLCMHSYVHVCVQKYVSVWCVCVHKLEVDIRCLPLCSSPCILKVSLNVELADSGRLARR